MDNYTDVFLSAIVVIVSVIIFYKIIESVFVFLKWATVCLIFLGAISAFVFFFKDKSFMEDLYFHSVDIIWKIWDVKEDLMNLSKKFY